MAQNDKIKNESSVTPADREAILQIAEVIANGPDFIRGLVLGYAEAIKWGKVSA